MKRQFTILFMILFIIGGLFALCSCGFSPMHDGAKITQTAEIFVAPISGANGIDMRNTLRADYYSGDAATAKYTLDVDLDQPKTIYKALQITGDATWQEVKLTAKYRLIDAATGKLIIDATDTASESYAFVSDLVASQASYNSAVAATIRTLAQKIETRVNAKLPHEI